MKHIILKSALILTVLGGNHTIKPLEPQNVPTTTINNETNLEGTLMEINIGLPAKNRKKMAQVLNTLLADEFLLYIKTINFHWNVKSRHFRDMHKLFLDQYEMLLQICDDIAERVRSIDEPAFGTMQEFMKHARLSEKPGAPLTDQQMIKTLLEDHEAIIKSIRKDQQTAMDLEDMGSNNFLLNLLEKQEKMAWMLRASLVK